MELLSVHGVLDCPNKNQAIYYLLSMPDNFHESIILIIDICRPRCNQIRQLQFKLSAVKHG